MPTEITRRFVPATSTKLSRNLARLVNDHHGGSVRRMARALRCDHTTLWRLANGDTDNPSVALLRAIAKLHETTLDQLLT